MENKIKEVYINNKGYNMTIIAYRGALDCDIQFENGLVIKSVQYGNVKKGRISNPNHPSVYGVGFEGQGKYIFTIKGKNTKAYEVWHGMLRRCYDLKFQTKKPTYKGCSVCEEWHNFQNFAQWFEKNYQEGYHLDKDILKKGNKIYSPETCCLVPHEINLLFIKNNKARGEYPIGVNKKENRFEARLGKDKSQKYIGSFSTPEEAFQAYKTAKEVYIKELADKWRKQITDVCYQTLIRYEVEITD